MHKAKFWNPHYHTAINECHRFIINKHFDNFEEKLQTSKWYKINKTSTDTAFRDTKDLIEKDNLKQTSEGDRNASYEWVEFKI